MTEFSNQFIRANLKYGDFLNAGKHFYILELLNLTDVSLNIKVPLTECITSSGEKIPQKQWGGSVNGVKGIVLDPSGFCSMHLIYMNIKFENIKDRKINVVVDLISQGLRLFFKFQAGQRIEGELIYDVIDFQSEGFFQNKAAPKTSNKDWMRLLERFDALEASLANALSRLVLLEQNTVSRSISNSSSNYSAQNSFDDVMDWILVTDIVLLSDLRDRLLPLNLLIGAVIADLNEKALDQTGELALEEDGENLVVNRAILQKIRSSF